ncbi:uncharacterized protein LOC105355916 isoform X2 [Oryzias latipes]|uniref:uncharacterized protein LOC105355916 isoform X2 n=1 Tax=Oryzias latipes TaxID=8090 RepID=UPI0005CC82F0|nr:uncharacterized protein LOC105355916 isoform X2 [Oryzias latipes]
MAYFHFQLIISVSFLLNLLAKCSAVSASPDVRTAFLEEEVSLSCLNSTLVDMSTYRVRWMKTAGNTNGSTIFEWPSESLQTDKVVWKEDGDGNMCVFLKNPGQLDAGLYTEEVWKGWKLIEKKYIQLKVKNCKVLQAVMAAPGYPLTLKCNPTSETSNVTWAKLKGQEQVLIRERNDGPLVFQSVNTSDAGWYRCTFMLSQRQHCHEINLVIQDSLVITTTAVVMATTNQALEATEQVPSSTSTPVVASVVSVVIIIIAVLTALIIYFKFHTQKSPTQLTRGYPAYMDTYENMSLPDVQDDEKKVNSLYYFEEENISTFQY